MILLRKILLSLILLLGGNSQSVFSQDTNATKAKETVKYNIGVKSSYSTSLTETEKNYIKKNIYEILMQTNRFNIILGHQYKKTKRDNLFSLTLQITDAPKLSEERDDDLNVKLILKDEVEGYLINFKQEKRVLRNKLQSTLRSMIYGIFYGKNYDEELDKVIVDQIIPLKKKANLNKKNEKSDQSSEIEKKLEPTVEEIDPQPPEQEEEDEDKDDPPEEEKPKKEKKKKKKEDVEISDFDSPNLDLEKEDIPKREEVEIPDKWANQLRFYFGNVDEEIISDSIVQIGTTTSRIVLGVNGHQGVEGRNHFYTFGAEVGLIKGEHEFGFGPKYDIYGGYNIAPFGKFFSIGPAISLSNLNYAAVFERGAGTKKFSGSGIWAGAKSEIFIDIGFIDILFDFRYQKVMVGSITSSAGDEVEASGTKTIMQARIALWNNWGIGVRNESIEMSTLVDSNLVVRDDSFGIFLTYQ